MDLVRVIWQVLNPFRAPEARHSLAQSVAAWAAAVESRRPTSAECHAACAAHRASPKPTATLEQHLSKQVLELDRQVAAQAGQRAAARLLMTHPGVGPVTALATEVFLGDPQRFASGKDLASYVGMIPSEYSSGNRRQRLGALSKQGNPFLRFLWVEATLHAVRKDAALSRFYRRKLVQKGLGKARVAAARKLGIRLWIMLRDQIGYEEFCRRG